MFWYITSTDCRNVWQGSKTWNAFAHTDLDLRLKQGKSPYVLWRGFSTQTSHASLHSTAGRESVVVYMHQIDDTL